MQGSLPLLNPNLLPLIERTDTFAIVGTVRTVHVVDHPKDYVVEFERGTLDVNVEEVIAGDGSLPLTVSVPFSRVVDVLRRVKWQMHNAWESIDVDGGGRLVLICPKNGVDTSHCDPLGGAPDVPEGDSARMADQVRSAYAIERFVGDEARRGALIESALVRGDFLRQYALRLIGERASVPRASAYASIEKAFTAPTATADDRRDYAWTLERAPIFDETVGAERVNAGVIGLLANGLSLSPDAEQRSVWVQSLRRCVLGRFSEDAATNSKTQRRLLEMVPRDIRVRAAPLIAEYASEHPKDSFSELDRAWSDGLAGP